MGKRISCIESLDCSNSESDIDASNQRSASYRLRTANQLTTANLNDKISEIIAFSFKKFEVEGQFSSHYQIEILAKKKNANFSYDESLNYLILLVMFTKEGLIIKQLKEPYNGTKKTLKAEEGYNIKAVLYSNALNKLIEICNKYQKKQYSIFSLEHCQSFANQMKDQLKRYADEEVVLHQQHWVWRKRGTMNRRLSSQSQRVGVSDNKNLKGN